MINDGGPCDGDRQRQRTLLRRRFLGGGGGGVSGCRFSHCGELSGEGESKRCACISNEGGGTAYATHSQPGAKQPTHKLLCKVRAMSKAHSRERELKGERVGEVWLRGGGSGGESGQVTSDAFPRPAFSVCGSQNPDLIGRFNSCSSSSPTTTQGSRIVRPGRVNSVLHGSPLRSSAGAGVVWGGGQSTERRVP